MYLFGGMKYRDSLWKATILGLETLGLCVLRAFVEVKGKPKDSHCGCIVSMGSQTQALIPTPKVPGQKGAGAVGCPHGQPAENKTESTTRSSLDTSL